MSAAAQVGAPAEASRSERRTLVVTLLTAAFMVVEVAAGVAYGSMALLGDGLHMGSHAVALGIAAAAYVYARRRATDERFAFGTGKVNALGGFTGALLLGVFAAGMALESGERLLHPVAIVFDQAIGVALVGLLVNGLSVVLLGGHGHDHDHDHDEHEHEQAHEHDEHAHAHERGPAPEEDLNLRSAYLHVVADALTSIFALVALLAGKYAGLSWLDPVMGLVGSVLVARWSWQLLRDSSAVLLDHQAPAALRDQLRAGLEGPGDARVVDLRLWSIGPGVRAACVTLAAPAPLPPADYKRRVPEALGVRHLTLELDASAPVSA